MLLRRGDFYPLLCLFLFLSRNWTEASVVDECSSTDSTTAPSFDDSSNSKEPNEGHQLPTTADVSSKDNTKHIETKTEIAPSSNSVRKTPKLNRSEQAEETVESAYFPGAEIPADVEKALASIFSQKDPQWVDCPNCKDEEGNPLPRQMIPDDMKQAIGDFAKKFHESREEGPLIDESQVPKERATATIVQEHLTSPSPKEEKPATAANPKSTNPKQNSNCKLKQEEAEIERIKTPQVPSISESSSHFSSFLGVCFQKKFLLLLFTLLLLVSTISAVLFVYGPSDVLQWILAVIYSALKLLPEHRKWDQKLQEETGETEDLEHERPQRSSSRNGRMKSKDSGGKSPTSKKKVKSQIHQKSNLEGTGTSSSKKEKPKSKSTGLTSVKKGVSKSKQKVEQSERENDDNNTWQEVTAKGRSGRAKSSTSSSREDQDIFPCGNRTTSPALAPTKAPSNSPEVYPPSTPDNPQPPSEGFAESPPYQAVDRVQKEKIPDPPKPPPEKVKTKEEIGPIEENKGGTGPTEDQSMGALELTMNTSGAFSDSRILDLATSDPPGTFSLTRVHQIKTEVYNERKPTSPFLQQPSPHQPSPFAVPLDLPFSAVNMPFSPVAGGGSPLLSPTLPSVMQRGSPTSPRQYFNETNTAQSRISCLLQNLKNKPFSQNTVSQCLSPMGIKRLQSEDLNTRSPPARLHSGGYGVLDASRSSSLSGNLNNRVSSSCQFPGLVNEGFLPQQSVQMGPEFHLSRQFSGGAPSRRFPAISTLDQRTGSLPLTGPRPLASPQNSQAVASMSQHLLTNDCSLFSSNPSIWSVDLAVDKELVNSSINGARFNASSTDGGVVGGTINQELQQNVDFRMCLPDQLLSDTNATG